MKFILKFITAIHLIMIISFTHATDWKKWNLLGSVKSIEERFYQCIDEKCNTRLDNHSKYFFNEKGFLVKEEIILTGNSTLDKRVYVYNDSNQKLREDVFNKKGDLHHQFLFKYDKSGLLISKILQDSDGINLKFKYRYDKNKVLLEENSYTKNDALYEKKEYIHNVKGQIVEDKWLDANKNLMSHSVLTYDDKDNLIKTVLLDEEAKVIAKYTYKKKLDNFGNWTEKAIFLNGILRTITEREILYFK